jgi:hypothetical protein
MRTGWAIELSIWFGAHPKYVITARNTKVNSGSERHPRDASLRLSHHSKSRAPSYNDIMRWQRRLIPSTNMLAAVCTRRIKPIIVGSRAGREFECASLGADYRSQLERLAGLRRGRAMKLGHQHQRKSAACRRPNTGPLRERLGRVLSDASR